VEASGFGVQPCAGLYLEVLAEGTIRSGDPVTLH
jgi:MOSC domain-containing protein YiiM